MRLLARQSSATWRRSTLRITSFKSIKHPPPSHSIYFDGGSLNSDYNCFYGTGTGYYVGYDGTDRADLAAWNTSTGADANSVEGNPGFMSLFNLHIDPAFILVDAAGTVISGITTDIDGDLRDTPPDIGADEYGYGPEL